MAKTYLKEGQYQLMKLEVGAMSARDDVPITKAVADDHWRDLIERGLAYREEAVKSPGSQEDKNVSVMHLMGGRMRLTSDGHVLIAAEVASEKEDANPSGVMMKNVPTDQIMVLMDMVKDDGVGFDSVTEADVTGCPQKLVYMRYVSPQQLEAFRLVLSHAQVTIEYDTTQPAYRRMNPAQRAKIKNRDVFLFHRDAVTAVLRLLNVKNQRRHWRSADTVSVESVKSLHEPGVTKLYC